MHNCGHTGAQPQPQTRRSHRHTTHNPTHAVHTCLYVRHVSSAPRRTQLQEAVAKAPARYHEANLQEATFKLTDFGRAVPYKDLLPGGGGAVLCYLYVRLLHFVTCS